MKKQKKNQSGAPPKPPLFAKILLILSVMLCACVGVVVVTNVVVLVSTRAYICDRDAMDALPETDSIVVLGAKVNGGDVSVLLRDRVEVGIQAYRAGVSDKLLLSGDHGRVEYDEVNAMLNYALDQGVDEQDAFLDHAGFSTYESMYRARDIFDNKRILIVSNGSHLPRAVFIARALGLEAYGVRSDLRNYGNYVQSFVREALARTKDVGYTVCKPAPTYLGDVISISGDARVTHDKPQKTK